MAPTCKTTGCEKFAATSCGGHCRHHSPAHLIAKKRSDDKERKRKKREAEGRAKTPPSAEEAKRRSDEKKRRRKVVQAIGQKKRRAKGSPAASAETWALVQAAALGQLDGVSSFSPAPIPPPGTLLPLPFPADGHGTSPHALALCRRLCNQPHICLGGHSLAEIAGGGQHLFRVCATGGDPEEECILSFTHPLKAGALLPRKHFRQPGATQPTLSRAFLKRRLTWITLVRLEHGDSDEADALEAGIQEVLRACCIILALMAAGREHFHSGKGGSWGMEEQDSGDKLARAVFSHESALPAGLLTTWVAAGAADLLTDESLDVTASRLVRGDTPSSFCTVLKKDSPVEKRVKSVRNNARRFRPGLTVSCCVLSLAHLAEGDVHLKRG